MATSKYLNDDCVHLIVQPTTPLSIQHVRYCLLLIGSDSTTMARTLFGSCAPWQKYLKRSCEIVRCKCSIALFNN